ncbi:hypothetical protein DH2020_047090 [Rehmannia glutinosa]|uniref:S-acyltransferase n=1 Tax=Rehmannia glutinosa TaxID=99300 RepID=A0ABR0U9E4_REHGL
MRKHGWELPYHPLQVVAVAVFLALGFAFYVFFAPFVGKQLFQYIVMGIYTPLGWRNILTTYQFYLINACQYLLWKGHSSSTNLLANITSSGGLRVLLAESLWTESCRFKLVFWRVIMLFWPVSSLLQTLICAFGLYIWCAASDPADSGVFRSKKYLNIPDNKKHIKPSESKHGGESTSSIRDANAAATGEEANDEGKVDIKSAADRNTETERKSTCFVAMLALLPCAYNCNSHEESSYQQSEDGMFYCSLCEVELILQWSTGILVLILCFIEKKKFATDISSKLGSSFTVVPFVIVVAVCTILAMIATLPLAQLFFFHILLIKKGARTASCGGQQSPQMSPVSSITGLSSASSFNTFHRAAWCTPPRLFVEDQYDVVPPDNVSISSLGKKTMVDEQTKKKNPAAVKISPWTLARLNADDVSKAAAEARKKSKILRPVMRSNSTYAHETDSSFGSSSRKMALRPDTNRKRGSRRIRLPAEMPIEPLSKLQTSVAQNHHKITDRQPAWARYSSKPK